jgi:hypothetical protein
MLLVIGKVGAPVVVENLHMELLVGQEHFQTENANRRGFVSKCAVRISSVHTRRPHLTPTVLDHLFTY